MLRIKFSYVVCESGRREITGNNNHISEVLFAQRKFLFEPLGGCDGVRNYGPAASDWWVRALNTDGPKSICASSLWRGWFQQLLEPQRWTTGCPSTRVLDLWLRKDKLENSGGTEGWWNQSESPGMMWKLKMIGQKFSVKDEKREWRCVLLSLDAGRCWWNDNLGVLVRCRLVWSSLQVMSAHQLGWLAWQPNMDLPRLERPEAGAIPAPPCPVWGPTERKTEEKCLEQRLPRRWGRTGWSQHRPPNRSTGWRN